MAAIDRLLVRSTEPAIIIVQADHGPDAEMDPNWRINNTNLSERMSIFNAYYFNDQDYSTLYEGITPVNTFRVVLNKYFGAGLELLVDRVYFSTWNAPYSFTDVTAETVD